MFIRDQNLHSAVKRVTMTKGFSYKPGGVRFVNDKDNVMVVIIVKPGNM